MDINPENVLSAEHQSWLSHPVTQQMFKNLEKYKLSFGSSSSKFSTDFSQPDVYFRLQAYGTKTVEGIIQSIKITEKFIEQTTK